MHGHQRRLVSASVPRAWSSHCRRRPAPASVPLGVSKPIFRPALNVEEDANTGPLGPRRATCNSDAARAANGAARRDARARHNYLWAKAAPRAPSACTQYSQRARTARPIATRTRGRTQAHTWPTPAFNPSTHLVPTQVRATSEGPAVWHTEGHNTTRARGPNRPISSAALSSNTLGLHTRAGLTSRIRACPGANSAARPRIVIGHGIMARHACPPTCAVRSCPDRRARAPSLVMCVRACA